MSFSRAPDMTGRKFGKLTVVSRAPNRERNARWHCVCECGGTIVAYAMNLRSGGTTSCGCVRTANFVANLKAGTARYNARRTKRAQEQRERQAREKAAPPQKWSEDAAADLWRALAGMADRGMG